MKNTTKIRLSFSSHLSASTLRSVPARIMTCQCLRSSAISAVIWFLAIPSFTRSRHLSFGLPRFRFPSTVICDPFLVHGIILSRICTSPNHLNFFSLRNPAIGYMRASFQMSIFSHMIYSRLSSFVPKHAHFSCVQFPLLLPSNCPTSFTIHHGRFYSRLVHFVFQVCWYVPVAHHPVVSLHFDQAIFTLLFTSFSASNNLPRYCIRFFFLNVDSLVFFWAWHAHWFFLCLHFSPGNSNVSLSISRLSKIREKEKAEKF